MFKVSLLLLECSKATPNKGRGIVISSLFFSCVTQWLSGYDACNSLLHLKEMGFHHTVLSPVCLCSLAELGASSVLAISKDRMQERRSVCCYAHEKTPAFWFGNWDRTPSFQSGSTWAVCRSLKGVSKWIPLLVHQMTHFQLRPH